MDSKYKLHEAIAARCSLQSIVIDAAFRQQLPGKEITFSGANAGRRGGHGHIQQIYFIVFQRVAAVDRLQGQGETGVLRKGITVETDTLARAKLKSGVAIKGIQESELYIEQGIAACRSREELLEGGVLGEGLVVDRYRLPKTGNIFQLTI